MAGTARPFRFTVGIGANLSGREAIREFAKKAEDLGYSAVTVPDHFSVPSAPFIGLLIAAEATTTLRIGTLVIDNDFRHPAVLAKEAATVDVMTGGRLELGMGAGWLKNEYEQTGISYDRPGTRIERLAESLEILTGLFADGPFSFAGKHYNITNLEGSPKPVQRPRPPIQVGGGAPVILRLAGRLVDSISIAPRTGATGEIEASDLLASGIDDKLKWIAEGAGSRMADIELGVPLFNVSISTDRKKTAAEVVDSWRGGPGTVRSGNFNVPADFSPDDLLSSPFFAIGTPEQIMEHFREMRERFGISLYAVLGNAADEFAPVVAGLHGE